MNKEKKIRFIGLRADDVMQERISQGVEALKKETNVNSLNQSDFMRKAVDELLKRLKVK